MRREPLLARPAVQCPPWLRLIPGSRSSTTQAENPHRHVPSLIENSQELHDIVPLASLALLDKLAVTLGAGHESVMTPLVSMRHARFFSGEGPIVPSTWLSKEQPKPPFVSRRLLLSSPDRVQTLSATRRDFYRQRRCQAQPDLPCWLFVE